MIARTLIASLIFFWGAIVHAEFVNFTMMLSPAAANTNRLGLTIVQTGGSTTTDLAGSILATVDIDRSTGVITSLALTGGSITTTDWTIASPPFGLIQGVSIRATTNTLNPPTTVTGTTFDATQHLLISNSGNILVDGASIQNFSTTPLDIPGLGNGTLTSTAGAGVFNISFSMPIDSTQRVNQSPQVDLRIVGNLVATGTITAVPEPASGLLVLAAAGCCYTVVKRRRRR